MAIFAIVNSNNHAALQAAILANYPDALHLSPGQWLVSAPAVTAKEISDRLGISDGRVGSALVISVAGYFGRQPTNTWDWIRAKWEKAAS